MTSFFNIFQIIIAGLLITAILLQQRGAGLSSAFGGGESNVYSKKRGFEKLLFTSTIVLAVLFIGGAIANLFF
ncbi:MAG: preprotein translocase subunit SecG [Parcubacteria group bacterium CG11_big_fil_rev_8_21_14_0_20_39_14]|nr:MAG: preprotein translocase subunit SecG [Parcubacteria group bacterium CG11_big_fil_rev_8_21_14_0_20_39_14]PIS35105.1 MAG: preprotein translocase subunit SecG [Parcubacteria group bacterium CG08_land_8_20_14_0_20_38_56]